MSLCVWFVELHAAAPELFAELRQLRAEVADLRAWQQERCDRLVYRAEKGGADA